MRIILDPMTVARLILQLTPAEDAELERIAESAGGDADELEACAAVSAWLLNRFPQAAVSIRSSANARNN